MVHVPFLTELIVFLIATVVVVPLARALHLSPILGYLAIGVLAGPSWLGLVHNVEQIRSFAELGVVFLLFAVGLELSFERLKTFAPMIFGLGAAQVVTTSAAIAGIAYLFGNSIQVSVLLGLCLSLSSTAMVIQLLSERGQLVTRHGRASFAVLLFQDLAVVPILMLVTVFGSQGDGGDIGFQALSVFFKALLATGLIILIGHFLLPRLFHLVTASRAPEVFVAMALLTILATSLATGLAGLSMALGAFLAGLLLSKTEFRHQIESDIEPFKGLLLGLFFMTVGMSIDLAAIADRAVMTALSVIGLIALKAVIVFGLCLAFGLQREVAIRVSLLLAEAGEFAFVVIGVATLQYALIPDDVAQFMVIVAGTSMALTPLLALGAGLLGGQLQKHRDKGESAINIGKHSGHVIVAGFGRVGRSVAKLLAARDIPYVAVDRDLKRVREGRREGMSVVFGNAIDRDLLEKLGADHAALVLVALGDAKATTTTLQAIRSHWPSLKLLARAHDADHAAALLALGIEDVVPETLEASLQLGGLVLRTLGVPAKAVNDTIERARTDGYQGHDDDESVADDQKEKTGKIEASAAAGSARPTSPGSI
ncbi:MAG: monovalent cation:proton antiporter-2 (CPA2) family protein [Geminicoccaceae bacterium]